MVTECSEQSKKAKDLSTHQQQIEQTKLFKNCVRTANFTAQVHDRGYANASYSKPPKSVLVVAVLEVAKEGARMKRC